MTDTPEASLAVAEALKPCPFCGGEAKDNGHPRGIMGQIYCSSDDCFGPITTAGLKEDSVKQWNTRAAPTDTSAGERGIVQPSIATKPTTDATGDSASELAIESDGGGNSAAHEPVGVQHRSTSTGEGSVDLLYAATVACGTSDQSNLAARLERLCCAETEGKFFDCVTDNIQTILAALRRQSA